MIKQLLIFSIALASTSIQAQVTAGKTMIAKGKVAAKSEQQASRSLKRRSLIYDNEVVTTGGNSKAQLRMTDGGMIALKENSELVISQYNFASENERGSVAMELLKGGLRSVTGAIKAENGDYNLKTPVGSIGIRGTHFEVELVDGDMFIAVWDGAIDFTVINDTGTEIVSFGDGEDYSYGKVSQTGEVTQLLEAPETFDEGHSSEQSEEEEEETGSAEEENETEQESSDKEENPDDETEPSQESEEQPSGEADSSQENEDEDNNGNSDPNSNEQGNEQPNAEQQGVEGISSEESLISVGEPENIQQDDAPPEDIEPILTMDNPVADVEPSEEDESFLATDSFNTVTGLSTEELIAERQGSFSYGAVENAVVGSSAGAVSDFSVNMEIDFDKGTVPTGEISFKDPDGEWFVAFSGIISTAEIDLDVTFASHGNNLADGDIDASFFDGLDSIVAEFDLYEIKNPDVKTKGSFIIK